MCTRVCVRVQDTGGFQAKASVYGGFDSAPALTDEERARARFGDEEDDMPVRIRGCLLSCVTLSHRLLRDLVA